MPDTVTRHRITTTTTDAGGNTVAATWDDSTLPGRWLFAPSSDGVTGPGRDGQQSTPALYGPPSADVTAADQVTARGQRYRVVGHPEHWGTEGTVVHLERVDG